MKSSDVKKAILNEIVDGDALEVVNLSENPETSMAVPVAPAWARSASTFLRKFSVFAELSAPVNAPEVIRIDGSAKLTPFPRSIGGLLETEPKVLMLFGSTLSPLPAGKRIFAISAAAAGVEDPAAFATPEKLNCEEKRTLATRLRRKNFRPECLDFVIKNLNKAILIPKISRSNRSTYPKKSTLMSVKLNPEPGLARR